jgi:phospholipase/carboxylesterase
MAATETVEIETGPNPSGSVIWLHGLGADGHDFEPIVPELRLPGSLALRFVFPHAPVRPVTINGGMSMRAWYDIFSLDRDGPVDEDGIRRSGVILDGLIRREQERGIDARRIVVAGFSQGGAIAIHSALRFPDRLAGLMALSTYLPLHGYLAAEVLDNEAAANKDLPIFMAHGSFDPVLPFQMGRSSADLLIESGFNVEWHDYPMAHAVCTEEIDDIRQWLVGLFSDAE